MASPLATLLDDALAEELIIEERLLEVVGELLLAIDARLEEEPSKAAQVAIYAVISNAH